MKLNVDITCPVCRHKFKVALAELRPGNSRICARCRRRIKFTGDDASKIQREIDKTVRNLKRAFDD